MKLAVCAYTATTALGPGRDALWQGLRGARGGLVPCDFEDSALATWIGRIPDCEATQLPAALAPWDCRNNRLAELGLRQDGFLEAVAAACRDHAPERIGLFMGTSTSGIGQSETAYGRAVGGHMPDWFDYARSHDYFSVAGYVRARLGLAGPAMTISTACSSSAKVFAAAARSIAAGFCDIAVVGGVDSLCLTTLYGFNSLQLVSPAPCRPCDAERDGISIGEAAGFALVVPAAGVDGAGRGLPQVLGAGESGDAHHMTAPEPEGAGARLAMQRALDDAGLEASAIDYVNLHGTATPANDRAEAHAVVGLLGERTPVSSTKGWTGHTLGAAGIVEAAVSWLALEHGWLPQTLNTRAVADDIAADLLLEGRPARVNHVLSNAFGFGGSNCVLVLG